MHKKIIPVEFFFRVLHRLLPEGGTPMTKCGFCVINFPLLLIQSDEENLIPNHKCGKCFLRKPGLLFIDLTVLNVCFHAVVYCNIQSEL